MSNNGGFHKREPKHNVVMKPVMTICIDVLPDNRVEVRGFPNNYKLALKIMAGGMARVASHFIQKAHNGEMDDDGNIEKPMIQPASQMPNKSRFPM